MSLRGTVLPLASAVGRWHAGDATHTPVDLIVTTDEPRNTHISLGPFHILGVADAVMQNAVMQA